MNHIWFIKFADEQGVKIYNATHGRKLEVFERVDFEKVISGVSTTQNPTFNMEA